MKLTAALLQDVLQYEQRWCDRSALLTESQRQGELRSLDECARRGQLPRPPAPPHAIVALIESAQAGGDGRVLTEHTDGLYSGNEDVHERLCAALEGRTRTRPLREAGAGSDAPLRLPGAWEMDSAQPGRYRRKDKAGHTVVLDGQRWVHRRMDGTVVESGYGQASLTTHLKKSFPVGGETAQTAAEESRRDIAELTDDERQRMYRRLAGEIDSPLPKFKSVLQEHREEPRVVPPGTHERLAGTGGESRIPEGVHERLARAL